MTDDEFMTAKQVAAYLGIGGTAFREARRNRELPEPVWIGGSPKWRRGDFVEWARALQIVAKITPAVLRRNAPKDDEMHRITPDGDFGSSKKGK